jgi:SAM-dependent methyltransferase
MQPSDIALNTLNNCLLCHSLAATRIATIHFDDIWDSLKNNLGAVFSVGVIERHTPSNDTGLYECQNCGLQYFSPAQAGDEEFYQQLTTTTAAYYSPDRWDFFTAASLIAVNSSVLDIACGSGRFLEILRSMGVDGNGIDTNPAAVRDAQDKGLAAFNMALDDRAEQFYERFDFVTAFQVIEHVPDVRAFVKSAVRCLKPGGKLVLTVPNRLRRVRDEFEPLDCPPHHLSRWSSGQFQELASLVDCRMGGVYFEPAGIADCRTLLRRWIAGSRSEALWVRAIARVLFDPMLYKIYRHFGLLDRWKLWRLSVMCILEKRH